LVNVTKYKQIEEEDKLNEIFVKTEDSQEYYFSEPNFYIENDTLYGNKYTRTIPVGRTIAFSEIASIQFEDFGSNHPSLITVSEYQKIEAETGKPDEIYVTKLDSTKYHFMKNEYYLENDKLYGKGKIILGDREQKIALSDIESIQFEYLDGGKTAGLVLGIVAIFFIIGAIAASSMRFGSLDLGEL